MIATFADEQEGPRYGKVAGGIARSQRQAMRGAAG